MKTPGAANGTITLRNACHEVAPSTCAACSISHGISRKNADSVQIASGRVKDMYGMISPGQVLNRPSVRHMSKSGPTSATIGNMAIASARDSTSFLPLNSSRAIAYAANVAKMTARIVAMMAIPNEFRSESRKSLWVFSWPGVRAEAQDVAVVLPRRVVRQELRAADGGLSRGLERQGDDPRHRQQAPDQDDEESDPGADRSLASHQTSPLACAGRPGTTSRSAMRAAARVRNSSTDSADPRPSWNCSITCL